MPPIYYIYLLTFLVYPLFWWGISLNKRVTINNTYLKVGGLLFLTHNILFFIFGYSLKGDYPDYIIFSLEYFFICMVVAVFRKVQKPVFKIPLVVIKSILLLGFLQALPGILFFTVISQEYVCDKLYNTSIGNDTYQVRRYSFGFATFESTRYDFDIYKQHMGFEKLLFSKTILDAKDNFWINDKSLSIKK